MDTATRVSPERFAQGMSIQEFMDNMQKNRDLFDTNYRDFELDETDRQSFRTIDRPLNVLVLAEDWCGDVLRYLPVFKHITEAAPAWKVKVFRRDENPDLAEQCLKAGKYKAIPVFKFFDEDFNELTCFTERPAAVYEMEGNLGDYFAAANPDLPDATASPEEMSEGTHEIYVTFVRQFRADNRKRWQQLFVDEIKAKLQGIDRE